MHETVKVTHTIRSSQGRHLIAGQQGVIVAEPKQNADWCRPMWLIEFAPDHREYLFAGEWELVDTPQRHVIQNP